MGTHGTVGLPGRSRPIHKEIGNSSASRSRYPVLRVRDIIGVMMTELHASNAGVYHYENSSQPGLVCAYCSQGLYLHHCCKYKPCHQTANRGDKLFCINRGHRPAIKNGCRCSGYSDQKLWYRHHGASGYLLLRGEGMLRENAPNLVNRRTFAPATGAPRSDLRYFSCTASSRSACP